LPKKPDPPIISIVLYFIKNSLNLIFFKVLLLK